MQFHWSWSFPPNIGFSNRSQMEMLALRQDGFAGNWERVLPAAQTKIKLAALSTLLLWHIPETCSQGPSVESNHGGEKTSLSGSPTPAATRGVSHSVSGAEVKGSDF